MRQKLSKQNLLFVGFTLFSMFFGAGNLIFPPFLGAQAGTLTWHAMAGFLISAVGLPVLGVAAVALSGGLPKLAGKVHPAFAFVFTLLVYLSIGPCLAIPRTASTSFEMTVLPVLAQWKISMGNTIGNTGFTVGTAAQFGYSAVFFLIAMTVAFRPDKLTDRLGKVLCPALLILIGVIFIGCLVWPMGPYGTPSEIYRSGAAVKGFLEGYQTMDTIAALNFGIIISINIRAKGVEQDGSVVRETVKAGVIAGILLAMVYGALAHIGGPAGRGLEEGANGARILTLVAGNLFGNAGKMILGVIFFIACLNTCIGLLSCCSQYFTTLIPVIGYRLWVFVFAAVSLVISSAGLNKILAVSVPVLGAVYPVAIMLIVLAFLGPLTEKWPAMFPCTIFFTGAVSVVHALEQSKVTVPALTQATTWLPGYSSGLGWIVPALAGMAVGVMVSSAGRAEE
ncbi:MAG: branched-chain amino acid transport system II carrier protein [Clostridium sp.]|nr:branched-chain amino acid transport system II carrier protein [Clostridium sp.]